MSPLFAGALADAVLVVHVAVAAFVVLGLLFVFVGAASGWRSIRDRRFRVAHLAAIGIVVAESWFGVTCPLTSLEQALRARAGSGTYDAGFVEHALRQVLFFEAPPWVFVAAYSAFGLLVAAAWWRWPPESASRRRAAAGSAADRRTVSRLRVHERRVRGRC